MPKHNVYNTMKILNDSGKTYIQVSKTVRLALNNKKLVPRESYEDVIRRLLDLPKREIMEE